MKNIFLLLLPLTILLNADLSVKKNQDMILKIHEKREGVDLKTLESTKEPFVRLKEKNNVTKVAVNEKNEAKIVLHAIVNGKA